METEIKAGQTVRVSLPGTRNLESVEATGTVLLVYDVKWNESLGVAYFPPYQRAMIRYSDAETGQTGTVYAPVSQVTILP